MAKATKSVKKTRGIVGGLAAAAIGIGMMGLAVFMALSFLTGNVLLDPVTAVEDCWTGMLGAYLAYGGINTLGLVPAMVTAVLVFFWGAHVAATGRFITTWPQVFGGGLIIVASALGACAFSEHYDIGTGGLLAVYVSPPAILYFGRPGLILAAVGVITLGVLLAFGESAVSGVHRFVFFLRDAFFVFLGILGRTRDLFRMLVSPKLAVAGGATADGSSVSDVYDPVERTGRDELTTRRDRGPKTAKPTRAAKAAAIAVQDDDTVIETDGAADDSETPSAALDATGMSDATDTTTASAPEKKSFDTTVTTPPTPARNPLKDFKPRSAFHSRFLDIDYNSGGDGTDTVPVQAAIASTEAERPAADVIMDVDALTEESDRIELSDAFRAVDDSAAASDFVVGDDDDDELASDDAASDVLADAFVPPPPPVVRPAAPRQAVAAVRNRPGAFGEEAPARERPAATPGDISGYQLPSLDLLDEPPPPVVEDRTQVENRARILEQTLAEFKIEGKVVHIERGPRVTMYEISLAPGIRLSKVTSLADNIAMQLKAESVRIIAPIPGKNTIGIEIPNLTKELVSLREIVGAVNREKKRQALPVCLGKDVSGQALVADLARMPHLLIAGATGSGKSVCINSIILSVMMCCKPDETQLIMVDPKVVELSRFKDIPHLMSPVITDMKRAVAVLDWICQKMDERYEQLSQVSVNNIAKFNALGEDGIRERLDEFASQEEIEAFPKKLPYMVVIIDELADLMMVAGKDVEHHITRLAAKSRAVGIHLILATQRPSVDVITGLIKANMPCRIAFQVASRVDSRTILDGNGAETLLGQGDMLYLPPGVGKLTRAQGVFVSDEELFRVVKYTKSEAAPRYHPDLTGPVIGNSGGAVDISTFDELFMQSGEAIIESQRGSVSLLQRKFGIGYGRASRIIDQLESVGLLGPFRDGKAREILLTLEEFRSKFGGSGKNDYDDDDADDGSLAGLRDDEHERDQLPWDDEE